MRSSAVLPTSPMVDGSSGACTLSASDTPNSSSGGSRATPGPGSVTIGSDAAICMPSAAARCATARAVAPKPRRPSVRPASSRPISSVRGHSPAMTRGVAVNDGRESSSSAPMTCSATLTAFAPVARCTAMPRACRAGRSRLSVPTPRRPTVRSRGAAVSSSVSTCVRSRTISPSASATASRSRARSVTRLASTTSSTAAPRRAMPSGAMNSLTTTRGRPFMPTGRHAPRRPRPPCGPSRRGRRAHGPPVASGTSGRSRS